MEHMNICGIHWKLLNFSLFNDGISFKNSINCKVLISYNSKDLKFIMKRQQQFNSGF